MTDQGHDKFEFEQSDADISAVTRVGLGIAVVTALVALALVPILKGMIAYQAKDDAAPPPIAGLDPNRQAPEPRLQREPFGDWTALKARQEQQLHGYGWVDEANGVTRIPIELAMRMVVERGLPARAAASPAPAPPSSGAAGVASPAAPAAPGHTTEAHP